MHQPTDITKLKMKLAATNETVDGLRKAWTDIAVNEINARLDAAVSFGVRTADFSFGTLGNITVAPEQDMKVRNNKNKLLNQIGQDIIKDIKEIFSAAGYNIRPVDESLFVVEVPSDVPSSGENS